MKHLYDFVLESDENEEILTVDDLKKVVKYVEKQLQQPEFADFDKYEDDDMEGDKKVPNEAIVDLIRTKIEKMHDFLPSEYEKEDEYIQKVFDMITK